MSKISMQFLLSLVISQSVVAGEFAALEVRDPTRPLGHSVIVRDSTEQQWILNSVLIGSQRKLAVINGATLREGQMLPGSDNIKVKTILVQAVVLQQADRTWVLKLSPSVVRKR